ncbi:MAG: hypothetical protein QXR48_03120 [Candidatus Woesearchaeota archaeon]
MAKKAARKKAKPKAKKPVKKASRIDKKALQQKETKMSELFPPLTEKEMLEEGTANKKDEFFDEEEMKEFSLIDEEEGQDEEVGEGVEGEPAWDEEEY